MVFYGYLTEIFFGWYSANQYEGFMIWNRMTGPYAPQYWTLIFCNGLVPQLLWFKRVRTNLWVLFVITIIVNIGMWLERFVIVVTSLHRDYLPSSWDQYAGTWADWGLYIGTIGFFLFCMCLFVRWVPIMPIFELREILHKRAHKDKDDH